ncbi:MAG: hypothetical protein ACAI35_17685 [Candidatus Methylacidiphilales bacterium]|nr:hypothetical protein [Candidatus Methylacidiphilales bacterium]
MNIGRHSSPFATEDELLEAVVVYEDASAAERALSTLKHLTLGLGDAAAAFRPRLCRFDVVDRNLLAETDTGDATAPRLVFICSNGNQPLPEKVKTWISGTLAKNTHLLLAVVALIGADSDSVYGEQEIKYLEKLALESGFHFFTPYLTDERVAA